MIPSVRVDMKMVFFDFDSTLQNLLEISNGCIMLNALKENQERNGGVSEGRAMLHPFKVQKRPALSQMFLYMFLYILWKRTLFFVLFSSLEKRSVIE